MGSTAYVMGSSRVRTCSHTGRFDSGYSAPERKNMGIRNTCVNAKNVWMFFILAASITPSAVRVNDSSSSSITRISKSDGE
jgi:hypothetical protein